MKKQTGLFDLRASKSLFLIVCFTTAFGGWSTAKAADPGPVDLKRLCEELHAAITASDDAKAAKITQALLPDKARIQKALGDKVSPDVVEKIVTFHSSISKDPQQVARLLQAKPEQKNVMVHSATTEEISRYEKDSTAFNEFPGGARKLAEQGVLRPGMTFYEVEFIEPGKDAGMKYHLFYWDGNAWTMLGPIWRAMR